MKFITTILLLFLTVWTCYSQKEDRNWVFGVKCGLNFADPNNPVVFTPLGGAAGEGAASISDTSGILQLYYLGYGLRNGQFNQVPNGEFIYANYSMARGIVILPFFKGSNKYHVIYTGYEQPTIRLIIQLYHSVVDFDTISSGITVIKNELLFSGPLNEGIAAVLHGNGTDWWVVAHENRLDSLSPCTNTIFKFLVKRDSIYGPFMQNIGTLDCTDYDYYHGGSFKFSQSGNLLAYNGYTDSICDLFSFNRWTGELCNHRVYDHRIYPYDAEFSLSEQFLYVSIDAIGLTDGIKLYQYNLNAKDIAASRITINDSISVFGGGIQIAPNNKIYLAAVGEHALHVINKPDSLGLACDFQLLGQFLGDSSKVGYGLPNMPNYNLASRGIYTINAGSSDTLVYCKDQSNGILLGSPQENNIVYLWSPSRGLSDTTIAQPLASPTKDLWYYMTAMDTTSCNMEYTDSVFVKVDSCATRVTNPELSIIKVYPNPAKDNLTIEGLKGLSTFQLYDLYGREVLATQLVIGTNKVETKNLASGIYIYRVTGESKIGKVLIEK